MSNPTNCWRFSRTRVDIDYGDTVFARVLYPLISYLLLPWAIIRLLGSGLRDPRYFSGWSERLGFIPLRDGAEPLVWMHAVSVGEVQAASPLIDRLLDRFPGCRLLVTTMTPAGADILRRRYGRSVDHHYLPYDVPVAVARFVRRLRPAVLIVLETELWPNLFRTCRRLRVPIVLVNARLSARSAAGYARVARLIRATLADIELIAAQSRVDAERFVQLGAAPGRTRVIGNLKYDVRPPAGLRERARSLRRLVGAHRPVWIAASTHEGEERQVLAAFARILSRSPDCLLLLAPRHAHRFERVAALCRRRGLATARRSRDEAVTATTRVYLIDDLGDLPVYYAVADVAFVGGSLVPAGGHNLLEPAGLGIPVITGPYCSNFEEIAALLQDAGAAWTVSGVSGLADRVCDLFADPGLRHDAGERGRAVVATRGGGVERLLGLLRPHLPAASG